MSQRKPNPIHLTLWAIAGGVIMMGAWFALFLPFPHLHSDGYGIWKAMWMKHLDFFAFAIPFLIGLTMSVRAEKRFNKGLRDELWTEAELAPVLSLVSKPIWIWAILVAFLLFFVFRNEHGYGGLFFIFFFPIQVVMFSPIQVMARTRQLLAPKPTRNKASLGLQNFSPIQSEHWGERAVRAENLPS